MCLPYGLGHSASGLEVEGLIKIWPRALWVDEGDIGIAMATVLECGVALLEMGIFQIT